MKKAIQGGLSVLLCAGILVLAIRGGGGKTGAEDLAREFCEKFGRAATVYAPTVAEGERGYCGETFFQTVFSDDGTGVTDFSVIFFPSSEAPGECGILVCNTRTEARRMATVCRERIDRIAGFSYGDGERFPTGSFLFREGKTVVYGVCDDAERAERIFGRLI